MENLDTLEWALRPRPRRVHKAMVEYGLEATKALTCRLKISTVIKVEIMEKMPFFMRWNGVWIL
jgi:hypothetical protein